MKNPFNKTYSKQQAFIIFAIVLAPFIFGTIYVLSVEDLFQFTLNRKVMIGIAALAYGMGAYWLAHKYDLYQSK